MFTHKKVESIKRGLPIPTGAKYLRTETKKMLVAEGPLPEYDIYDSYLVDVYEIPCNEDGSTEIKVTYESKPESLERSSGPCCGQRDCNC